MPSLVQSVAMDTTDPGVGTVAPFHFQGRVVVVVMDMWDMGLVQDLLRLEHNPLEGVGKDLLVVDKVVELEGEGEGDVESLLVVCYELP